MEFSRRYHLNVIKELCIKCRWMLLLYLLLPWIPSGVAQIVWREIPQNVTINLDETVEIPCRIDIDTLPAGTGIMWSFRETASSTTINLVVGSRTSSVRLANRPHLSTNPNNVSTGRYNLRITGASLDDDGIYNCEILGDVRSGQIIVQVPPRTPDAITTNSSSSSSSLVFQENSGLSLTCVSRGGNPPPDFLWLKNGEILLNPNVETSPSKLKGNNSVSVLSLRLDWKDDTAQYTCRVWNIANRDTPVEASITLSVQYVPQITFDDYPVKQNGSVRWPCDVQANPAPSIQWEKTGQPSFSVSGEVLELTNVQRSASGEYSCIASNNLGETTRRATLDVQYAPIITLPVSVVVNESSSLNITCYYDANPVPFSIQWSKSNRLVSTTIYDQSLTWNQISRSDRGVYSCSVRNRLSTFDVLDSTAEVTVSVRYPPGPASISGSSGESVNRNETFTLTCQADDPGYPHAFFRWFKVNKSKKDLIFVGPIYTKTNVQYADAGRYECEPSNMMGLGTSVSVAVVVNVPPSIVESSPAEISISTTVKDFSLNCSSIARPQPRILWFWNGQRITRTDLYQTNSSFTQQDEGRFLVTSWLHFRGFSRTHMKDGYPSLIRKEDFGNYTCQAASAHHPVAKHTMFLKVLYAPDILKIARFGRIGADIGSNPYITCEGDAYPEITLRWFLQGQELSNNNKYHIELGLGNGFNMVKKVLTIRNFADSDYAVYECIGLNRLGQATENVTLVRKSTPEAPTNLQNVSIATTSVMLRWFVGFNGGHHQAFFVNIRNVNADVVEQRKVAGVITSGLTVIFNVTDLLPGTLYTFQVTATNELGTSPVSAPLTLTLPGSPTEGETQDDGADGGLTMNEVIIVACVCSLIVVALLIILIVVIIRRKREQPQTTQAKDYESETNRGRPQPINGASRSPNKKQATTTLGYDNPGAVELKHNNGNVINGRPGYQAPPNNVRLNGSSPHDILYDSHETPHINYSDENERHIHIHGQFDDQPPPYNYTNLAYTDHPDDPTSPPKDHIDLNLNGMESGYSTPEPSKPKKVIYEVVV